MWQHLAHENPVRRAGRLCRMSAPGRLRLRDWAWESDNCWLVVRYSFGPFTLDLEQRRLFGPGDEVPLSPKALELLALLIRERPRALSKTEILDTLWHDTFVSENTLATVVRDLRHALSDTARAPRFIRTAYAFGYAFIGDVEEAPLVSVVTRRAAMPSQWRLVGEHRDIALREGDQILGRSGEDVVVIDAPTISRRHAHLSITGDRVICEDLGSKNGTWVGQTRVTGATEIGEGQELRLGSVVLILCRVSMTSTQSMTSIPHAE